MKKYTISMMVLALAFFGYACSDDNNDSAEINVSDTVVDFGDIAAGTSTTATITVTNQGDVTLDDVAVAIDSDAFTAEPLEFSLNVGGSQEVTLTFAPETQGDFSAEANISAVSQNLLTTVNLAGFATDELVGSWVSEGEDVAPGLAAEPFLNVRIDATFNSDNTYDVESEDQNGSVITFEGTWEAGEANADGIRAITLNQSVPSELTSSGIFRVNGDRLEYEVIQEGLTGVEPATVEGGFGSTLVGGQPTGGYWTQRYDRVEE